MTNPADAATQTWPATRWQAMFVLLIASFMNLLDVTIVNVALPTMRDSFGATSSDIQWVVAAYTLAFALGLLPFGRLGDTFGRKRMFVIGVVAFTFASFLCGIAPNVELLIAARVLQGFSSAIMAPQTLAIAQVIFPPHERGAVFSLFGLTASLASVSGPIAGGLLIGADIHGLDWRPIFLVNIPVGLLALVGAFLFIPKMPGHKSTGIDIQGMALAGLAMFLIVFPLIEGRGFGWPAWCFAMMAAALPAGWAFIVWQKRQAALNLPQLMPVALLADTGFVRGALLSALFFSCVPGFFLVMAVFLQSGFGLDPLQSGLTNLPFSFGILFASIASGRLGSSRLLPRIYMGALGMAAALGWLWLIAGGVSDPFDKNDFLLPLFVAGLGMGTAIGPLFQAALGGIAGRDAGSASGAIQAVQQAGGALGVAIMGEIFFSTLEGRFAAGASEPHPVFVDSLQNAIVYALVALVLVAFGSYWLRFAASQEGK